MFSLNWNLIVHIIRLEIISSASGHTPKFFHRCALGKSLVTNTRKQQSTISQSTASNSWSRRCANSWGKQKFWKENSGILLHILCFLNRWLIFMTSPINCLSHKPRKVWQSKSWFQADDRLFMGLFLTVLGISKVPRLYADIPQLVLNCSESIPDVTAESVSGYSFHSNRSYFW